MSFSKDHFVQLQAENTAENKFNFDMQMFEVNQETQTVNLTKIAKHLNKRLDVWLKSKNTKAFIQAYSTLTPNGGIRTLSGFSGEQGTFADRKVALKFAQWVSPEFEIYCLEKLDTLFQTGKVELQQVQTDPRQLFLLQLFSNDPLEVANAHKQLVTLETKPLLEKIENDKPNVEFANQLLESTNALDFGATAKAMNLGYGRTTLFAKCRELGILRMNNEPYQNVIDNGYMVLMETSFIHPKTGDRILTTKPLITGKGQKWLLNKLNQTENQLQTLSY